MPEEPIRPEAGTVAMRDIGEEVTASRDMTPAAQIASARAEVEARIAAARKWPRDVDQFRLRVLKECQRPKFAEMALYERPVGKKKNQDTGKYEDQFARDFSIRFIETAAQLFGNMRISARIRSEDAEKALLVVEAIDLETNVTFDTETLVYKLVERRDVKAGRKTKGTRTNSYGDLVYLIEATNDEFKTMLAAERSKQLRTNALRLIPRDVLEDCREAIDKVLADENAKDPDSAKKKILDRFAALGVSAVQLKEYLGRPLETLTQQDLTALAAIHNGLREGEFTWSDLMNPKEEEPATGGKATLRDRVLKHPGFGKQEPPPDAA